MAKQYTIFAIKNTSDIDSWLKLGVKLERSKANVEAAGDISFVSTDGMKMFILGDAESLNGVKPSDTGFGSTCGVTPAKVQEMADVLNSMGYTVDVTIAYDAISKVSMYPEPKKVPVYENEEDFGDDEVYYELTVSADKEDMIEEALELAATIGNVEGESEAFVVMCEYYLKSFKKS